MFQGMLHCAVGFREQQFQLAQNSCNASFTVVYFTFTFIIMPFFNPFLTYSAPAGTGNGKLGMGLLNFTHLNLFIIAIGIED